MTIVSNESNLGAVYEKITQLEQRVTDEYWTGEVLTTKFDEAAQHLKETYVPKVQYDNFVTETGDTSQRVQ